PAPTQAIGGGPEGASREHVPGGPRSASSSRSPNLQLQKLGGSRPLVRQPATGTRQAHSRDSFQSRRAHQRGKQSRCKASCNLQLCRHTISLYWHCVRHRPVSAALRGRSAEQSIWDCKDKHTLLASLLGAAGIRTYPALISSAHEIDPDVPSPGQFDHVISVVPRGKEFLWLDTTPEVAPFAYLITPLRDKQALVIPEDGPPTLMTSPVDPPVTASQTFQIRAKLNDAGTLEGKIERAVQGDDTEVLLRTAFRRVPLPQWKYLVQ